MVVSLKNVEDDDPKLVASFPIASDVYDLIESQIEKIGLTEIPGNAREQQSVRRWTLYIGTLFGEMLLASVNLSVFRMPRAQCVLNRQLFEYLVRNQWIVKHPDEATRLLDCLPGIVQREVQRSSSAFDRIRPANRIFLSRSLCATIARTQKGGWHAAAASSRWEEGEAVAVSDCALAGKRLGSAGILRTGKHR